MSRNPPLSREAPSRGWDVLVLLGILALGMWWVLSRVLGPAVNEGEPADLPDPGEVYDPVAAGEQLPPGYRRVTGRDRIRPIYAPRFMSPADTDWPGDTLVLGVARGGEAKAYPIRTLNRREMVLDRLGGTPILATW